MCVLGLARRLEVPSAQMGTLGRESGGFSVDIRGPNLRIAREAR
jgi:hypothetical protein